MPTSLPLLLLLLASHESSRVDRSYFSVASWRHHTFLLSPLLHKLSPLHIHQKGDVAPPTTPRLLAVSLCKSYQTGTLLPVVCLLTPASLISHLPIAFLYSPLSFAGTLCEYPLPSLPLTPKEPTFLTYKIETPAPPPCRSFSTPWYLIEYRIVRGTRVLND